MDELTRTEIASENYESRKLIHADDTQQICDLRDSFDKHRKQNEEQFKVTRDIGKQNSENIKKLLELSAVIFWPLEFQKQNIASDIQTFQGI